MTVIDDPLFMLPCALFVFGAWVMLWPLELWSGGLFGHDALTSALRWEIVALWGVLPLVCIVTHLVRRICKW